MRIVIKSKGNSTDNGQIIIRPARIVVPSRPMRVLDFDAECRPLHWINSEYVSREVTALAWAWADKPSEVSCYLLGETDHLTMLGAFVNAYNQADMVTGHYIRGFDLPLINSALMELKLPVLGKKMSHDTKIDLVRQHGLSMSQESLGTMLRLDHKKIDMNQGKWRAANRLQPEGLAYVRERVVGDVQQHIEMHRELLSLDYLTSPKMWESGTFESPAYTP